jgi:hypothetical protein
MDSSHKKLIIEISLLELLHILKHSTKNISAELQRRVSSEFALEIKKRGYIDNDILGDILCHINPSLKKPEKIIVATRTVPYWWPEEMGLNGLMWRDVR